MLAIGKMRGVYQQTKGKNKETGAALFGRR
jgi:hypothetical protein